MEPENRRQILLGVLAVVLVFAAYRAWSVMSTPPSAAPAGATGGTVRPSARSERRATPVAAPDVHLNLLEAERASFGEGERNLFRFRTKPSQPVSAPATVRTPPAASGPPTPGGPPPITLKFIGVVERRERSEKIAVLRDAVGHIFSGREGTVVEGRFRILRIGAESIEMSYLDGRGRQTIRMSGG